MKIKLKVDKKAIVSFFVQHTEKIVFAGAVVAFAVIVYGATTRDTLPLTPEQLQQRSSEAQQSWADTEIDESIYITPGYYELALQSRNPIDEDAYLAKGPDGEPRTWTAWNPLLVPQRRKRGEPPVYPVEGLRGFADRGRLFSRVEMATEPAGVAAPTLRTTSVISGQNWIVLTALVPLAEQTREYEAYFKNTQKSDPLVADVPVYVDFVVQRVEVRGQSAGEQIDWSQAVVIDGAEAMLAAEEIWDPTRRLGTDVESRFVLNELVFPLPPAERLEWSDHIAYPPQIPLQSIDDRTQPLETEEIPELLQNPDDPFDVPNPVVGAGQDLSSSNAANEELQYRLFRFFDFDVQPGKCYRYRVRLVLDNPNRTEPEQYLSDEVLQRRDELSQRYTQLRDEGKTEEAAAVGQQWTRIQSGWSEPTQVISVPRESRLLAGAVRPARDLASEPSATMAAITWVPEQGIEVCHEPTVHLGQVVNCESDQPDPSGLETLTINHVTDTVVLDLRGGDRLDDSPLRRPGAILLLDPDGNLVVRHELDDQVERDSFLQQEEDTPLGPMDEPGGPQPVGRGSRGAAPVGNLQNLLSP